MTRFTFLSNYILRHIPEEPDIYEALSAVPELQRPSNTWEFCFFFLCLPAESKNFKKALMSPYSFQSFCPGQYLIRLIVRENEKCTQIPLKCSFTFVHLSITLAPLTANLYTPLPPHLLDSHCPCPQGAAHLPLRMRRNSYWFLYRGCPLWWMTSLCRNK